MSIEQTKKTCLVICPLNQKQSCSCLSIYPLNKKTIVEHISVKIFRLKKNNHCSFEHLSIKPTKIIVCHLSIKVIKNHSFALCQFNCKVTRSWLAICPLNQCIRDMTCLVQLNLTKSRGTNH